MFGWKLIRKRDFCSIMYMANFFEDELAICESELEAKDALICTLQNENKRLFDYHNNRLTKPKIDKNGKWRNPNGTFAKARR